MDGLLIQIILAAGNSGGEDTFWIQILVFLLVAVSLGVYGLVKKKPSQVKGSRQRLAEKIRIGRISSHRQFQLSHKYIGRLKTVAQKCAAKAKGVRFHLRELPKEAMLDFETAETAGQKKLKNMSSRKSEADLSSGMEMLELDFMLNTVENTKASDENDVTMRKLNFNELVRRSKLDQVNSNVLKVYAINRDNLYGKDIQCGAIKELAKRTEHKSRDKQSLKV